MMSLILEPGSADWNKYKYKAENNLYWFNSHVRGLQEPVKMTPRAHLPMCRFVERKTGIPEIDSAPVQLILVNRGRGKSGLITQGYVLQQILKNPECTWGIANEKAETAEGFLGAIKNEIESNEIIQAFWPHVIPDFRSDWKAGRITVNRKKKNPMDPSVLATGTTGTVTGVHLDAWIVDDVISQNAAENARAGLFTEIDKVNRWCTRLGPLLKDPAQGRRIFIGTRWWINDTYDFLIDDFYGKNAEKQEFIWTVTIPGSRDRAEEVRHITVFRQGEIAVFRDPAIDENGRAVHPELLDLDQLDVERERDPTFFQGQYMLNPSGGEAAEFKLEDLKTYESSGPNQIMFRGEQGKMEFMNLRDLRIVISVDPAISKKMTAARSAVVVVGTDGKNLFLLEAIAKRVTATELGAIVIEQYKKYKPYKIIIETVAYQEALKEVITLLADHHGVKERMPIEKYHPGTTISKSVRILGLEAYFRKGIFYYDPRKHFHFEEEYASFPHNKFRDLLDALSFQKDAWEYLFSIGAPNRQGEGTHTERRRRHVERMKEGLRNR